MKLMKKVILAGLLVVIATLSLTATEYVNAQFNDQYCLGKKDEMISRSMDWNEQWATALTDINGIIRSDGQQLTSEIGLTLVNCEPYLSAQDLLDLTNMRDLIDASIDRNVDFGPPCDPLCEPGPPVVYR